MGIRLQDFTRAWVSETENVLFLWRAFSNGGSDRLLMKKTEHSSRARLVCSDLVSSRISPPGTLPQCHKLPSVSSLHPTVLKLSRSFVRGAKSQVAAINRLTVPPWWLFLGTAVARSGQRQNLKRNLLDEPFVRRHRSAQSATNPQAFTRL